jgi:hypothetical protein
MTVYLRVRSMHMTVYLRVRSMHMTAPEDFVSYATIPDLTPPAEILLWGSWYFVRTNEVTGHKIGVLCPIYEEGMVWVCHEPVARAEP